MTKTERETLEQLLADLTQDQVRVLLTLARRLAAGGAAAVGARAEMAAMHALDPAT